MSSLEQAIKVTVGVTAAVALGTAYVLVHERRRKAKAVRKAAEAAAGGSGGGDSSQSTVLSATRLIDLLAESAKAAYQLIEQVRAQLLPVLSVPCLARVAPCTRRPPPTLTSAHTTHADAQDGPREARCHWHGPGDVRG